MVMLYPCMLYSLGTRKGNKQVVKNHLLIFKNCYITREVLKVILLFFLFSAHSDEVEYFIRLGLSARYIC